MVYMQAFQDTCSYINYNNRLIMQNKKNNLSESILIKTNGYVTMKSRKV